jgi:hypothetical protein
MIRTEVTVTRDDQSRLEQLYERHAGDGVRLAYLITGDRALAEDLVQDAFVRLPPPAAPPARSVGVRTLPSEDDREPCQRPLPTPQG